MIRAGAVCLLLAAAVSEAQKCSVTKETDPGREESVPCVFPFTYRGTSHLTCTGAGHPRGMEWCSTKVDAAGNHVAGGGHWGVCGAGCPPEPGCPAGWTRLATGCYRLMAESNLRKSAAAELCGQYGGRLVEVGSSEEVAAINSWYKAAVENQCLYTADIIWLGIHNDTAADVWRSDRTGEALAFTHWLDSEPNHAGDNEMCAAFFPNSHFSSDFKLKESGWFDVPCDNEGFSIKWELNMRALCERDVAGPKTEPVKQESNELKIGENGCYEGFKNFGDRCYLFETSPSTFREAKKFCALKGSYLAEIESQSHFEILKEEWMKLEETYKEGDCANKRAWWMGVNDGAKEGTWVSDRSGQTPYFTKWKPGEPNNFGKPVPGEDCAVAHLGDPEHGFEWYDVPCNIQGFYVSEEHSFSFNPLCEHERFQEEPFQYKVEGVEQDWVTIGDDKYKFIQTPYGVTRQEAQDICAGNGGFLATMENEEKRVALQNYYKKNVATQTKNYFLAALDFFSGSGSNDVKRAYWVGASDQEREGAWTWDGSGRNVSDSAWFFFGRGIPGEVEQFNEFGDDDCAIIFDKENILSDDDWGENEKYRARVEAEEPFKLMAATCFTRLLKPDYFNFVMSPLCQADSS